MEKCVCGLNCTHRVFGLMPDGEPVDFHCCDMCIGFWGYPGVVSVSLPDVGWAKLLNGIWRLTRRAAKGMRDLRGRLERRYRELSLELGDIEQCKSCGMEYKSGSEWCPYCGGA
ncbi:MAG TPA: hypothetical protein V6C97_27165 [Oculatellaceae cyanobacterium]